MWKLYVRWLIWGLMIVVAATLTTLLVHSSPAFQQCVHDQKSTDSYRDLKKGHALFQVAVERSRIYIACTAALANGNSGLLTFVVGLVAVGVYWRQTVIMSGQLEAATTAAKAASKAAAVAEEALRVGERPYMLAAPIRDNLDYAITNVNPANVVEPFTGKPYVTFRATNYGKTPAILREISADLKISATLPETAYLSKVLPRAGMVIPINYNAPEITCDADNWIGGVHRVAIADGEQHFWLVGELKYGDIFGNVTVAGFCFRYYVATKTFHEDGGENYNFQKTTTRRQLSA
jgi:hypothetical protein